MIRARVARETMRYVAIGGAMAAINNGMLIGGDWLGMAYPLVLVLTSAISGSLGYVLHVRFTFRTRPSAAGYLQFMTGIALGVPLTMGLLVVLISWCRLPMWIAAPATTLIMFLYNYLNARAAILWRKLRPGHRLARHDRV